MTPERRKLLESLRNEWRGLDVGPDIYPPHLAMLVDALLGELDALEKRVKELEER